PVVVPDERDRRFSAPEWVQSPVHDYLRQAYLLNSDYLLRAVQVLACDDERMKQRMVFATRCVVEAMAPSNFAATNPEFIRAAIDSEGESIVRGIANLFGDLARGRITMSDESAFEVGRNLAVTPGEVIFE